MNTQARTIKENMEQNTTKFISQLNNNFEIREYKGKKYVFQTGKVKEGWLWPADFIFPAYGSGNIYYQEGYYHGYQKALRVATEYLNKRVDELTQQAEGTHEADFKNWLNLEGYNSLEKHEKE